MNNEKRKVLVENMELQLQLFWKLTKKGCIILTVKEKAKLYYKQRVEKLREYKVK